jgi:transcriptional regulator with XRE-family HTH domain
MVSQGGNPDDITGTAQSEGQPIMTVSAPPIRRRLLGRTLRRHREALGWRLEDAARVLECDRSKVSRIETGERGIRAKELRELMEEYGVAEEQRTVLALLADRRGAFGWQRDYTAVLSGAWRDYLIMETAASKISGYDAQQVPGLLQIPGYARALAAADPSLHDDVARDSAAQAVLARQQAILNKPGLKLHLVIGEAALHQQVGSPEIMQKQLAILAQAAGDSRTITVQVLPFEAGAHAAAGEGSLALLQFDGALGLGLVHLGGIGGGVCLESLDDLNAYAAVFDQLRAFALRPAQSALLLRGLADC